MGQESSMPVPFTKRGGAQFGWVNASWPLARISATPECLSVGVGILWNYTFTPNQVSKIERYGFIPFLSQGIRVRHQVPEYPQRIIFWSIGNPETIIEGIREAGFVPDAPDYPIPSRQGIPMRWSAIIGGILGWNLIFMVFFAGIPHHGSVPAWRVPLPILVVLALIVAILKSTALQRLIMKPGRNIGEIKRFLYLIAFICGLLAIIFSGIAVSGGFDR